MPNLEDDLKLTNWLSIVTYDLFKYVKAGGEVAIEWTADGLTLRIAGVDPDTPGVHSRFLSMAPAAPAPPQEPPRHDPPPTARHTDLQAPSGPRPSSPGF